MRSRVWLWGHLPGGHPRLSDLLRDRPRCSLPFIVKHDLGGSPAQDPSASSWRSVEWERSCSAIFMGQPGRPGGSSRSCTSRGRSRRSRWPARPGERTWQPMLACFVFNALEAAGTIVWATTKQRLVPPTGCSAGCRASIGSSRPGWFLSPSRSPVPWPRSFRPPANDPRRRRHTQADRHARVPVPARHARSRA